MKNLILSLMLGLTCALGFSLPAQAQVSEAVMSADGTGTSQDLAIQAALVNAASQAFGVQINSSTFVANQAIDTAVDNEEHNIMVSDLNQEIHQRLNTPQTNPILGYDVVSVDQLGASEWRATVNLKYAKYEKIGADSNRRSLIVVTNHKKYGNMLITTVGESLVNSRRFDVLNRENDKLFQNEVNFILSADAAQPEIARLSQASGADYLVIADLPSLGFNNNQRETIRMTGEVLVKSSVSGVLRIQIIEFSSRKLKWQGTEKFGATYPGATAVGAATLNKLITNSANKLVDKMVGAIYPMRIVKVMGNNVIINRGEGSVNKGQILEVFLAGEELIDPQSGESLGSLETEIGLGEIVDVKPKFAIMKMAGGAILQQDGDYLVRDTNKKISKPTTKPAAKKTVAKPKQTSLKDQFLAN